MDRLRCLIYSALFVATGPLQPARIALQLQVVLACLRILEPKRGAVALDEHHAGSRLDFLMGEAAYSSDGIKQLEDLYRLSQGRLQIGFSQGALKSDAEYLGFDHSKRADIFGEKIKFKNTKATLNPNAMIKNIIIGR